MSTYEARLAALRVQLKKDQLDGFVVPICDEHMSEYVGDYAQRLGWLTGFGGSAGSAVVLSEEAAIFTDGRYTLQVREQVDPQRLGGAAQGPFGGFGPGLGGGGGAQGSRLSRKAVERPPAPSAHGCGGPAGLPLGAFDLQELLA